MSENLHRKRYREILAKIEDDYRDTVKSQREYAEELAQRVLRGEELDEMGRRVTAAILRHWAGQVSDTPKRAPGKPPEFDHAMLAWTYWKLRNKDGMADTAVRERLLTEYEIDDRHLARILKKHLPEVEAFMSAMSADK